MTRVGTGVDADSGVSFAHASPGGRPWASGDAEPSVVAGEVNDGWSARLSTRRAVGFVD